MGLYRKKPVTIEAFQWGSDEFPAWMGLALKKHWSEKGAVRIMGETVEIATLEGVMIARKGDYVIQGIHDEIYPCKEDIFNKTYDRMDK